MITRFDKFNLIKESPDHVGIRGKMRKTLSHSDQDAKAFVCEVNDDHTKCEKVFISEYSGIHSDIKDFNIYGTPENKCYPGRLWRRKKVMSFWTYPNAILFKDIIKQLEKKLKTKIFNNNWRIEVLKDCNDEISINEFDPITIDDYFAERTLNYCSSVLIPVEEYVESENFSEEEKAMHMLNWKEKQKAKKSGKLNLHGFGSAKTAWDKPHNIKYRRTIYQENKNN
jgi:hypothetical protein